jgi:hypothetical protein
MTYIPIATPTVTVSGKTGPEHGDAEPKATMDVDNTAALRHGHLFTNPMPVDIAF